MIYFQNSSICNGNASSINNSTVLSNKLNSTSNNTSDDSVSGEVSFDESENEEKETIQTKKKPKVNIIKSSRFKLTITIISSSIFRRIDHAMAQVYDVPLKTPKKEVRPKIKA